MLRRSQKAGYSDGRVIYSIRKAFGCFLASRYPSLSFRREEMFAGMMKQIIQSEIGFVCYRILVLRHSYFLLSFLTKCGYIQYPTSFKLLWRLYGYNNIFCNSQRYFSSHSPGFTRDRIEKEPKREKNKKEQIKPITRWGKRIEYV